MRLIRLIAYFCMGVVAYYQVKFRFNHPEMTETQLFLHFFDAFKG